jgi:hypothetical protein
MANLMKAFNDISRTVITVQCAYAQLTSVEAKCCTTSRKRGGD